jgi:hypothetical protein
MKSFLALLSLPFLVAVTVSCASDGPRQAAAPSNETPRPAANPSQSPTDSGAEQQTAWITLRGLDFEEQVVGTIEITEDVLTARYQRRLPNKTQDWAYKFDLRSRTYSSTVQESISPEVILFEKNNPFRIEQRQGQTILSADGLEEDGSLILEDVIVVRYDSTATAQSSAVSPTEGASGGVSSSEPSGGGNALIVGDPSSKNIRSGPGTEYEVRHIAYPGDSIQILETAQDGSGYTWYKVLFPQSGAQGWIAAQLVALNNSMPPSPSSESVNSAPAEAPSIPTGARCSDFASQAEAQAALPANPQLDRDDDGVACESLR